MRDPGSGHDLSIFAPTKNWLDGHAQRKAAMTQNVIGSRKVFVVRGFNAAKSNDVSAAVAHDHRILLGRRSCGKRKREDR